jgi:phage terminase large subunit
VFIGTPKGQNHFADRWEVAQSDKDWFSLILKASQTGILPEYELADARKEMTPEQYAAEYECSFFGAIQGSYYGREVELLDNSDCITDLIGAEPGVSVNCAWDVGGTTALWMFQCIGHEVRVIDYIEGHNVGVDWYVNKMRERPYVYGKHILPRDAGDEKEIVGISWVDALAKLGVHDVHVLPAQKSIDNGINTARLLLQRCRFVKGKTLDGVVALRNYRREYDDKRKNFRDHPLHDWASHGADAWRHLALGINSIGQAASWSKPINYGRRTVI